MTPLDEKANVNLTLMLPITHNFLSTYNLSLEKRDLSM